VDRRHKIFTSFEPLTAAADEAAAAAAAAAAAQSAASAKSNLKLPIIKEMWKPDSAVLPIFLDGKQVDKSTLFTLEECEEVLAQYIESHRCVLFWFRQICELKVAASLCSSGSGAVWRGGYTLSQLVVHGAAWQPMRLQLLVMKMA
jgi:hypothetical protein